MESLGDLADQVAALEERVADAVYEALRDQLRGEDAESAKAMERRLAKARRSLQKAEHLLRHGD